MRILFVRSHHKKDGASEGVSPKGHVNSPARPTKKLPARTEYRARSEAKWLDRQKDRGDAALISSDSERGAAGWASSLEISVERGAEFSMLVYGFDA